jgi:sporulation protein YlmC with PRC-barrel domain
MAQGMPRQYSVIMLKKHAIVAFVFMALLTGAWISTVAAPAGTNDAPQNISHDISPPLRARQLEGMKVEDSDGQKAGTVRNLVLNLNTGNLRYVVIGYGGILGVRATLKLAPIQVMSAATTKKQTLAINATSSQWRNAPAFKYSSLTALAEADRANEISRYFQTPAKSDVKGTTVSLSKTGRDRSLTSQPAQLQFASDIIGLRVVNQKQEKIGEVSDLLVSFGEPRPAFAIISSGRLFQHGRQYAVPLKTLTLSGHKLIWNPDAASLQNPRQFDQAVWQSRGEDGQVYSYSTATD